MAFSFLQNFGHSVHSFLINCFELSTVIFFTKTVHHGTLQCFAMLKDFESTLVLEKCFLSRAAAQLHFNRFENIQTLIKRPIS